MDKITKKDIRTLSRGVIPESLTTTPFAVLHHKEKMVFSRDCNWVWTLDLSPDDGESVSIDRKTALSIIEKNKMKETYRSIEGQVFEIPGTPFQQAYAGYFRKNRTGRAAV